jgi:starvation-inducible DNA-binding protein
MKNFKTAVLDGSQTEDKINVMIQQTKGQMFQTRNTLPEKVRQRMEELLQDRLSDSIDLSTQAKQAHWNVKGPDFIALHELFDKIAEESEAYPDLIAERIVQFGGIAQGTISVVKVRTSLPEYPLNITTGREHVEALAHTLATYGELVRNAVFQATELSDPATADILTEILRGVDKNLWFIEAHIQMELKKDVSRG